MTDEQCGATKGDGKPCEYEAKYADGKCGIHTDETETSQGRPSKFTDERARTMIEAAEMGKSERGCERAAGVGEGRVSAWKEKDHMFENRDGRMASFRRAFAQARATGESELIRAGRQKHGDTPFAKFMLSSSFGYQKTEKQEHEHSGQIDREHTLGEDEQAAIREALDPTNSQ